MKRVASFLAGFVLVVALRASAEQVVLPVVVYAKGVGSVTWATEIRATNLTDEDLSFQVVDFVGALYGISFHAGTFQVPAHQTRSLGAWEILSASPPCAGVANIDPGLYGAAIMNVEPGVIVQAAILAGSFPENAGGTADCGYVTCPSWQGGFPHHLGFAVCNLGAGPILDASKDFFPSGVPIVLSWLHTQETHRTNVTLYNPDSSPAYVEVKITSGDGTNSVTRAIDVSARGVLQMNDVFSSPAYSLVREHNGSAAATATATITSTTRLYAIAWVIANLNNTVSVAQPR